MKKYDYEFPRRYLIIETIKVVRFDRFEDLTAGPIINTSSIIVSQHNTQ